MEVIRVNGVQAPDRSLRAATELFGQYVAGRVRVVAGEDVQVRGSDGSRLTTDELEPVITRRRCSGPSVVTVLVAPFISDLRSLARCEPRADGSHLIWVQARLIDLGLPPRAATGQTVLESLTASAIGVAALAVPRDERWCALLTHELLHALGLPYDRSHVAGPHHHCARPECILYGRLDVPSVVRMILRGGLPRDLCSACQRDARVARQASDSGHAEDTEAYDYTTWLNALVELNPDNPRPYGLRAQVHENQGRYDSAVDDLTKAVERDPDNPVEYMYRAQAYYRLEEWDEVIRDLSKAIELGPGAKTATCYRNRGSAFLHLKDFRHAIEDLERCVELRPDDPPVLDNLARLLVTCADESVRNGPRAVELARRACELTGWSKPWALSLRGVGV